MVENRHHVVGMTDSSRVTQKGVKKNYVDTFNFKKFLIQFLRTKLPVTKDC